MAKKILLVGSLILGSGIVGLMLVSNPLEGQKGEITLSQSTLSAPSTTYSPTATFTPRASLTNVTLTPTSPPTPTLTPTPTPPTGKVFRPFTDDSYWNSPIPSDAPHDPDSDQIIAFLKLDGAFPFVRLTGLGSNGKWGRPIYWGTANDEVYSVKCKSQCPPELSAVHIPAKAKPDDSSDGAMTVYDLANNVVFGFFQAKKTDSEWSVTSSSAHYLDSNGLDRNWTQFLDTHPNNLGHRGGPASAFGVRWDEIQEGVIAHKLIISANSTKDTHVFPYVGDENGTTNAYAPPEGLLIRIKPSVDLSSRNLSPAARIVATALQDYGAVIGDQSGGPMNLKVEHTIAEGRGNLWDGVLISDALKTIPLDDYEVIQKGYGCGDFPSCSPVERAWQSPWFLTFLMATKGF